MDKQQAYYNFWSSFSIPAYDENSVPDGAAFPYITYQVMVDEIDAPVFPVASIWYRSDSWTAIDAKVNEISRAIDEILPIALDGGGYN